MLRMERHEIKVPVLYARNRHITLAYSEPASKVSLCGRSGAVTVKTHIANLQFCYFYVR
jgi:hypothetical protein